MRLFPLENAPDTAYQRSLRLTRDDFHGCERRRTLERAHFRDDGERR